MRPPTSPSPPTADPIDQGLLPWAGVARSITDAGMWCALETCADPVAQRWRPALILCTEDEDVISTELAAWIAGFPQADVRITGYARDTVRHVRESPAALCYLAAVPPVR